MVMHVNLANTLILKAIKINYYDDECYGEVLHDDHEEKCDHIRATREILDDLEGKDDFRLLLNNVFQSKE